MYPYSAKEMRLKGETKASGWQCGVRCTVLWHRQTPADEAGRVGAVLVKFRRGGRRDMKSGSGSASTQTEVGRAVLRPRSEMDNAVTVDPDALPAPATQGIRLCKPDLNVVDVDVDFKFGLLSHFNMDLPPCL